MILSITNQKGGVAKSTLAISLAWELMLRGKRVLIADADPQETCLDAVAKALQEERAAPECIRFGEDLHRSLPNVAKSYDWTIIDTPGRHGKVSRAALAVSDVALVPVRPSAPDAWALEQTLALISEARQAKPELRAALVLTQVRRTVIAANAREGLRAAAKDFQVTMLESFTTNRTAWEWAMYHGVGVTAHEPRGEAAMELRALLTEITKLQRGSTKR